MKIYLLYVFSVLGFLIQCGVTKKVSEYRPNYLESSDREGNTKDRFYLAYAELDVMLTEENPEVKGGNNYLFGIGCYDEPGDPMTLIKVPISRGSEIEIEIPLMNRDKLFQFKEQLKTGHCEILFGNKKNGMMILDSNFNKAQAESREKTWKTTVVGTSCGSIAIPIVGLSLLNDGEMVLDYQELIKNIERLKSSSLESGWKKNMGATLITTAFLFSYFSNGSDCYGSIVERIKAGKDFVNQTNRSLLFKYLMKAETIADQRLRLDQDKYGLYLKSLSKGDFHIATSIYNPVFVRVFNRQITGTFNQGKWNGPNNNGFFESVKTLQTKINQEFGKNFHSVGRLPANRLQCDEFQLQSCTKNGILDLNCFRQTCLNLNDILSDIRLEPYRIKKEGN